MQRGARTAAIGGLGLAALAAVALRGWPPMQFAIYPPCPVHKLLGLLCPGCGGTRAVAALLAGQWSEAVRDNALITASMPFAVAFCVAQAYSGLRRNRWLRVRVPTWAIWGMLSAALCFATVRNC